jgi:hypothetical protein
MRRKLKKINSLYTINAFIKGKLQTQKAKRELAYYRAEAEQKNIVVPSQDKLVQLLSDRLQERGINVQTANKGCLHIFVAYYVTNWEAALPKALKSFGKVTEFDWHKEGFNERGSDWLSQRDKMNREMLDRFRQADKDQKVDVVIGYLSGHNTSPVILEEMGKAGAVVFNFCWDDKLNFPGSKKGNRYTSPAAIADAVDLNLTNAPDSIIKYAVHGGLAMFWPEAGNPDIDRPYNVPFEFDVTFVGQKYGWRPRFIDRLRKMGINVTPFGPGWENGPLSVQEMVKLYSRSQINLGFAGVGYSKTLMCLKGRDFEVPMSGGLYLTQDNPELRFVYEVGREIETYKNEKECVEKIRYLLNHPEIAADIREAGRQRALRDHTWEKRFEQLFNLAGLVGRKG